MNAQDSNETSQSGLPDPRDSYSSPEDLREDVDLDLARREQLLTQWKQDIDSQLAAESEGMSASDPISAEAEAKLAAEARRVNKALESIRKDIADCAKD